jgi:predicted dehydrogenase
MLNIALIGYGYWGPNIARNLFHSKLTNLVSICDLKPDRLEMAKAKYLNQCLYTMDYKEYLNNPEIDAVAIAVETESHFKIAKEFILAGKHIFLEKPITPSVKEAIELTELAKKNQVTIHVDHIMIYHPAIKKVMNLIETGQLGDIIYFDFARLNLGKIKNDVSAMWDLAVHDLAIIDYLTHGAVPEEISIMGEKFWSIQESLTFLNLKYKGFLAHIKSSWISPVKERRIIIAGTKQMVVFDDMKNTDKMIIYDKGFDTDNSYKDIEYTSYAVKVREGDAMIPNLPYEDALRNSIEHFAMAVSNKTQSFSGPDQATRVIRILEEANKLLK